MFRRITIVAMAVLGLVLWLTARPVFAFEGVGDGETATPLTGILKWVILAISGLVIVGIGWVFAKHPARDDVLAPRADGPGGLRGYVDKLGRFNRNSRLLLFSNLFGNRPPLGGLGFGIWNVAFNLYLLSLGFDIAFIGTLLALRMLLHGIVVFPAGLICDAIGRRRSFLYGGVASVIMLLLLSLTEHPVLLLVVGALSGIPLALEHVAWEPFMMENSGEAERPYLFSMNITIGTVAIMAGSAIAAILPFAFGSGLALSAQAILPLRLTVLSVAVVQALSLVPLYLIRPQATEGLPGGITLANVQSWGVIGRLVVISGLTGFGLGFVMHYYNVFFAGKFDADAGQIDALLALGSLAAILGTLIAPVLAEKLGKVRMVSYMALLSVPFMVGIAWAPGLWLAGAAFFLANGLRVMGMPILSAFSMESVKRNERASTIGLTHMAFDVLNTPSTYIAGIWLTAAGYFWVFGAAALFIVVWSLLLLVFFGRRVPTPQLAMGSN